eukprot:CAMPEP_0184497746 /NCGR_PEP_ID=MMETSP0113_2-20130426/37322_1 /TAXON_ID=91329 /ORGANISM="Norrisiella sphaerica, Strain BC52" /LENGTH=160 /DNA_ID=CAMNT_0026884983 /DNA_START=93 /DNA_END=572 /DNA_ORIENTATION=-
MARMARVGWRDVSPVSMLCIVVVGVSMYVRLTYSGVDGKMSAFKSLLRAGVHTRTSRSQLVPGDATGRIKIPTLDRHQPRASFQSSRGGQSVMSSRINEVLVNAPKKSSSLSFTPALPKLIPQLFLGGEGGSGGNYNNGLYRKRMGMSAGSGGDGDGRSA